MSKTVMIRIGIGYERLLKEIFLDYSVKWRKVSKKGEYQTFQMDNIQPHHYKLIEKRRQANYGYVYITEEIET